jgi:ribosomal protein S12 methylthiotransferase accessory factor
MLAHYDFRKNSGSERGASGKGVTDEEAMLGAIGEAVEHYCASHPALKGIRRAPASSLDGEWVDPREFVLFSDRQYESDSLPFSKWDSDHETPWIRAEEMPSGKLVWVPATLVYLNYRGDRVEDFICAPTSSGLAAGPTLESAFHKAVLELLERDAFLVTWLNRIPVAEIDFSVEQGPVAEIRSAFKASGTEIRMFLLATDLPVTAVMAVALDQTGTGPAAIVGLGCDVVPSDAVRKALFEVGQIYDLLRRRYVEGKADALNSYSDVQTLEEHAAWFLRRDHLHELGFLLDHGRTVPLVDIKTHDASGLLDAIIQRGYRAFRLDLTTPDVKPYPIRVSRALVTQLQPIQFGFGRERLGGRRLYELPRVLAWSDGDATEDTLNPCPHPLA